MKSLFFTSIWRKCLPNPPSLLRLVLVDWTNPTHQLSRPEWDKVAQIVFENLTTFSLFDGLTELQRKERAMFVWKINPLNCLK